MLSSKRDKTHICNRCYRLTQPLREGDPVRFKKTVVGFSQKHYHIPVVSKGYTGLVAYAGQKFVLVEIDDNLFWVEKSDLEKIDPDQMLDLNVVNVRERIPLQDVLTIINQALF